MSFCNHDYVFSSEISSIFCFKYRNTWLLANFWIIIFRFPGSLFILSFFLQNLVIINLYLHSHVDKSSFSSILCSHIVCQRRHLTSASICRSFSFFLFFSSFFKTFIHSLIHSSIFFIHSFSSHCFATPFLSYNDYNSCIQNFLVSFSYIIFSSYTSILIWFLDFRLPSFNLNFFLAFGIHVFSFLLYFLYSTNLFIFFCPLFQPRFSFSFPRSFIYSCLLWFYNSLFLS